MKLKIAQCPLGVIHAKKNLKDINCEDKFKQFVRLWFILITKLKDCTSFTIAAPVLKNTVRYRLSWYAVASVVGSLLQNKPAESSKTLIQLYIII